MVDALQDLDVLKLGPLVQEDGVEAVLDDSVVCNKTSFSHTTAYNYVSTIIRGYGLRFAQYACHSKCPLRKIINIVQVTLNYLR